MDHTILFHTILEGTKCLLYYLAEGPFVAQTIGKRTFWRRRCGVGRCVIYPCHYREILPEEYGGALPRVENTQVRLATLKFEEYFKELKKLAEDNRGRY